MSLNQFEWTEDYDGLFEKEMPSQLLQNPLLQKDIWRTREDLGLEIHEHNKLLIINFSEIKISWLNLLTKLYTLKKISLKLSTATVKHDVIRLTIFGKFLENNQVHNIKYINNHLFEEFDNFLHLRKVSDNTIGKYYTTLKTFFNVCREEKWLSINTYWFKNRFSKLKHTNKDIQYIPEEVWNQLEENLYHFPEPMQRKILIIRTLGLRIGELLNLPLNCLRKKGNRWHLRLKETEKYKIEDELPIPLELVAIIKEQQVYIKKHFKDSYNKLFCSNSTTTNKEIFSYKPVGKVMCIVTFNTWLNRLSNHCDIRSKDGKIWNFTSHQFRRTIATIMTNAGVRDLIIQKYLRHRSPDMQNYYKHLLKEVIGDEYQELTKEKSFVNIEGKIVTIHKAKDVIEEYIRVRLHQISTQQGECHRNNLKKPCPTINACWRCNDWMTSEKDLPYLKQDLERLKDESEKVNQLGMVRVNKEIQKDINYLQIRINSLEEISNND